LEWNHFTGFLLDPGCTQYALYWETKLQNISAWEPAHVPNIWTAHGLWAGLFASVSMLGYWLSSSTLLILMERATRIGCGFHPIPAKVQILDAGTVAVSLAIANRQYWPYRAGQYILLQLPKLSSFQWHPVTISSCIKNAMQVHIKTDENWTSKLRDMAKDGSSKTIHIGNDGPFGAPAQQFYDFDQSIILGSGIGGIPFSGILADLPAAQEDRQRKETPRKAPHTRSSTYDEKDGTSCNLSTYRRVGFHSIVKDKSYLL
jgi:dual oxidase